MGLRMNDVRLSGTIVPGSIKERYDEKYEWWNTSFRVTGVLCCTDREDNPMCIECYTSCSRKKPELNEGTEVIISGVMCLSTNADKSLDVRIQVHSISEVSKQWCD